MYSTQKISTAASATLCTPRAADQTPITLSSLERIQEGLLLLILHVYAIEKGHSCLSDQEMEASRERASLASTMLVLYNYRRRFVVSKSCCGISGRTRRLIRYPTSFFLLKLRCKILLMISNHTKAGAVNIRVSSSHPKARLVVEKEPILEERLDSAFLVLEPDLFLPPRIYTFSILLPIK